MEESLEMGKKEAADALLVLFFSFTWDFPFCLQHMNDLGWNIEWRILKFAAGCSIGDTKKECSLPERRFESFCYLSRK